MYFYLILLALVWSLSPFIQKNLLRNLANDEYIILYHIMIIGLIILYLIYKYCIKKTKINMNNLNNLSKTNYLYLFIIAISSIIGFYLYLSLIKDKEVSSVLAQTRCLCIAVSVILGYFIFNEKLDFNKVLGIILIIFGIFIINMKMPIFKYFNL